MAKIDELAELLTEEIESFNISIKQLKTETSIIENSLFGTTLLESTINELQKQNTIIKTLKIKPDLQETRNLFNKFIKNQKFIFENLNRYSIELKKDLSELEKTKSKAPKHIIFLLLTITLLSLLTTFNIYKDSTEIQKIILNKEKIAYKKGTEKISNIIYKFFDDNPNSRKEYEKWSAK